MTTVSKRDYYEVLGVGRSAGHDEIRSAYRKLAMQYHPDKHQGDKAAEERFKEISEAYEVLSDPQKKDTYDRFGHEGLRNAFSAGGFQWRDFSHFEDISDLFENVFSGFGFDDLFGFGGRKKRSGPRQGASIRQDVEIELKEAAFGVEKSVSVTRAETCAKCRGTGARPGTKEETCAACGGRGQVTSSSGFFSISRACEQCRGRGSIIKEPCQECRGEGRVNARKKISVKIPGGVDNGTRLRVTGEGEAGTKGGPRGDLYVDIHIKKHESFERHEDDIYCQVRMPFITAVLGGEIEVPTLEGSEKLDIPAGTQSGEIFRLKHKGMHRLRRGGRGDQLLRVMVETPVNLTVLQKKKLIEFSESCGRKVQPKKGKFVRKIKDMLGR
ncbi:MAG: molecular chaperone DnaJ [Candidatus Omnitrophota bacterium]